MDFLKDYPYCKCLDPQRVMNPYTHEVLVVPCGKCKACQLNKAYRYNTQCQLEAAASRYQFFLTLTYRDEDLPIMYYSPATSAFTGEVEGYFLHDGDGVLIDYVEMTAEDMFAYNSKIGREYEIPYLNKTDVQLFIKRLRSAADYETEKRSTLRYYCCGEYGPEHYRPHYHVVLFTNEDWFVQPSGHKFGEFPAYLWYNSKAQYPKTSEDIMSNLEYLIFTRWKFGRIDCQLSQGKCSSYVTTYVNSFSSVPRLLKARATRPFSIHSRFLGQVFFKGQAEKVYSSPYQYFIEQKFDNGSVIKNVTLWRSYYNVFYPKCKGYDCKTFSMRLYSYQLLAEVNRLYPECKTIMDAARTIVNEVHRYCIRCDVDFTPDSLRNGHKRLIYYFSNPIIKFLKYSIDKPDASLISDLSHYKVYDSLVSMVYLELLTSKHFFKFCCVYSGLNPRSMVRKIDEFYQWIKQNYLSRFFQSQEIYFAEDFAEEDDYVYFYNNLNEWDVDGLRESYAYKVFNKIIDSKFNDSIKHKRANDKNDLFNPKID